MEVRRATPDEGFRWVKPAASLKQVIDADAMPEPDRFPLGKTGGLIEAFDRLRCQIGGKRRFRWVKPAASLKPR